MEHSYEINGKQITAFFTDCHALRNDYFYIGSKFILPGKVNAKGNQAEVFWNLEKQPGWYFFFLNRFNITEEILRPKLPKKYPHIYSVAYTDATIRIEVRNKTSVSYFTIDRGGEPTFADAEMLVPLYSSGYCRKEFGNILKKVYSSYSKEKSQILQQCRWSFCPSFVSSRYLAELLPLLKEDLRKEVIGKIISGPHN